jgi:hypothetical protein
LSLQLIAYSLSLIAAAPATAFATDPLATLRPAHPRLLLTDAQLAANLDAARTDPLRAALHDHLVRVAEGHFTDRPIQHTIIGGRLLDESRKAIAHVVTGAMAFRLTREERFATFAKEQMLRAAAFPDWNPAHFLDVAEMACALALGYDWLHAQLTPDERATIKRALLDKALAFARPAYARADPNRESFPFVRGNLHNNWNQVCNGGFLLAALALADEAPPIARDVIAGVRETLPFAMAAYAPDGAYPEGPVYWGYGTRYNVYLIAALESALGTDFGLARTPAFDRTALYRLHMCSPTGQSFNYADGKSRLGADDGLTWLAQRYRHPHVLAANRGWLEQLLREPPNEETHRFVALHAVWFPEAAPAPPESRPALDVHFRGPSQLAVFRSAWDDPRALWVGFKAGSNTVNHAHLDLGTFTLDADGVRWAVDLGRDDYDLPGYWDRETVTSRRWQYYRLNNHGHNTLTPGRQLQEPTATAPILHFASTPAHAFAVADLTSAYPGAATRLHRGLAMLDRARVLVQDDVTGFAPGVALTWRMLTASNVNVGSPRVATLTQDGRILRVELLAPTSARFVTRHAVPPTAKENQNEDITVLEAEIPAAHTRRDMRIAVLLSPVGEKWPQRAVPEIVPLESWK